MKCFVVAVVTCFGAAAQAQEVLYTHAGDALGNLQLSTGNRTRAGAKAPTVPAGARWSELQTADKVNANAMAGVAVHDGVAGGAFRIADRFVIPTGQIWRITGLRVFAYQPGALGAASPVDGLNFRVLTEAPDDESSQTLFGDDTTNRYAGAAFTGVYRTFASGVKAGRPTADALRPIWQVESVAFEVLLPAGSYWLDWQLSSVNADAALFAPTATVFSSRGDELGPVGALHLEPGAPAATWTAVEDPGIRTLAAPVPQRVPFQFMGELVPTNLADVARVSGEPGQDGAVDESDLLAYFRAYMDNEPLADVCGPEGAGSARDGKVTSADLVAFIAAYAGGIE